MNGQQERALTAGLKALAATSCRASASERVEHAVLAEMRQRARPARTSRAWLPLAAALMLACASGVWIALKVPAAAPDQGRLAGFMSIPGAAAMPPLESGAIVRVFLPVGALPQYGLPIAAYAGDDLVEADLLVAQDGHPRAIRLVNDAESRSTP